MFLRRAAAIAIAAPAALHAAAVAQAPAPASSRAVTIGASECVAATIGTTIPVARIGEPVRRITLAPPVWTEAAANAPAYCRVDGVIDPVDVNPTARPITFAVALPATWSRRAAQLGGGR